MRTARLLGVILTILTRLGDCCWHRRPARNHRSGCPSYVTDNAERLSDSGRAAVTSAIDKLYADRHIRLWVVYVDNFSGQSAENWASAPRAPATWVTTTRCWPCPPPAAPTPSWCRPRCKASAQAGRQPAARPDRTRAARRRLERCGGRRGQRARHASTAFVERTVNWLLVALTRRHRRRSGGPAGCHALPRAGDGAPPRWRRHGESTPPTPTRWPPCRSQALDDLSRSMVVDVDNAVRTSSNELDAGDRRVRRRADSTVHPGGEQRESGSVPSVHRASAT